MYYGAGVETETSAAGGSPRVRGVAQGAADRVRAEEAAQQQGARPAGARLPHRRQPFRRRSRVQGTPTSASFFATSTPVADVTFI